MKICVTSTSNDINGATDQRFGRCPYFAIYDSKKKEFTFIENEALYTAQGAGIAAAQKIIDEQMDIVITGQLGPNAMRVLNASNIKAYQLTSGSIEQQIQYLEDNKLTKIEQPGVSHFGMGNQHKRS